MSKHKHATFGSVGQYEFYLPTTGEGRKDRRDRKRCECYNHQTKICEKLNIECVGLSNVICPRHYNEKQVVPKTIWKPKENDLVNCPVNGVGMIMRVYSENCYEVKFHKSGCIRMLSRKEIEKIRIK